MGSTLIVAETAGRGVLLGSAEKACQSLNQRLDLSLPTLDVIHADVTPSSIRSMIEEVPECVIVIAEISPSWSFDAVLEMVKTVKSTGTAFAIAEQSVGSPPVVFSAGQILSLVYHGATAVFREYDFVAEDIVLKLLIEHAGRPRSGAILVGDPASRLKTFLDEIRLEWNDPDTGPVSGPVMAFRLACTLSRVDVLDEHLDTREKMAGGLCSTVFLYNPEDTRKALGSLTRVWGLHTRTLSLLPQEARRRGFPDPTTADALFDFIERIDIEERSYTAVSGYRFDILHISEG